MTHLRPLILALLFLAPLACSPLPDAEDAGIGGDEDAGDVDAGHADEDGGVDGGVDAGVDAGVPPKPDTFILTRPPDLSASTSARFTFIATAVGTSFECSVDDAGFASCVTPFDVTNLVDGEHRFAVRALDVNLVADETPAEDAWVVDATPPDTTITSAPTGDLTEPRASITSTCSETSCSFECALNDAGFVPCAATATFEGLSSGTQTVLVRALDLAGNADGSPASASWNVLPGTETIRVVAANITSGNQQSYGPEGVRILQGLQPDIVLIQEFKYGTSTPGEIRSFVDTTFGASFAYYRESGVSLPNGVISRYPIRASGSWDDSTLLDRDFAWARIDIPGPKDLWAVSLHLRTTSSSERNSEASALVAYIQANIPAGDLLVLGGDLNTSSRTESAITTLSSVVVTSSTNAPYPVDQQGNSNTNRNRSSPYDWVLADSELNPLRVSVVTGTSSYPSGLVFDSRVYTPLTDVSPVQSSDSNATAMQHMAVVKDFAIPY